MMSLQKIKKLAKKEKNRIGKKALNKISLILEEKAKEIIKKASMNSSFAGRNTIKEEDIA